MLELIRKIYNTSPQWLYVILLLFLIAAIVIFTRKGVIRIQLKRMLGVMFAEYLVVLLSFTVFYREVTTLWSVKLIPYQNYFNDNDRMDIIMQDTFLNVAMFIPVGFCSSVFLRYPKWLKIILLSATLSCSIEITQFILSRGECDVTDVINNSIGGLVGYWGYWLWKKYELRKD